jgi:hypothetical protein
MLIGLSLNEEEEFNKLDDTMPFNGEFAWPTSGLPAMAGELRWLELWEKHRAAAAYAGRVPRYSCSAVVDEGRQAALRDRAA